MTHAADIERACYRLRLALDSAADLDEQIRCADAAIRERYANDIRTVADDLKAARAELRALLDAAPRDLWGRDKTKGIWGIVAGWRKAVDTWEWPDDPDLVALIQSRCTLAEQASYLVTTTTARKDAIPVAVRRRLGIALTQGEDAPWIKEDQTSAAKSVLALLAKLPQSQDAP